MRHTAAFLDLLRCLTSDAVGETQPAAEPGDAPADGRNIASNTAIEMKDRKRAFSPAAELLSAADHRNGC